MPCVVYCAIIYLTANEWIKRKYYFKIHDFAVYSTDSIVPKKCSINHFNFRKVSTLFCISYKFSVSMKNVCTAPNLIQQQ